MVISPLWARRSNCAPPAPGQETRVCRALPCPDEFFLLVIGGSAGPRRGATTRGREIWADLRETVSVTIVRESWAGGLRKRETRVGFCDTRIEVPCARASDDRRRAKFMIYL